MHPPQSPSPCPRPARLTQSSFCPPAEPLVQKVRKAEEKARPISVRPTPGPSRSASLAPSASVALPPPSEQPDPLDGLTPIQRKLHQPRFAKVSPLPAITTPFFVGALRLI